MQQPFLLSGIQQQISSSWKPQICTLWLVKEKDLLVANILVKPDFKENKKLGTTNCDLSTILHKTSSISVIEGQIFDDRF